MAIAFHTPKGAANKPEFWPAYWDSVCAEFNPNYLPEFGVLMQYLSPGDAVLDIGCGRGVVVRDLLQQGYKARGIDFDSFSIFDSVIRTGYFPSEVGDLNQLPYQNNSFDAILLAGTIEHVFEGPNRGFAECFRVLRPGGVLVLTIPYINLVRKLLLPFYVTRDFLFSHFPDKRKKRFFEYVFTRSEVKSLLCREGFMISEWNRAYYTTVVRKIPGFTALHNFVFQRPARETYNRVARKKAPGGIKRFLKQTIEGSLNMIIPNRLLVVARKPHN